jgi:hypothetical protein
MRRTMEIRPRLWPDTGGGASPPVWKSAQSVVMVVSTGGRTHLDAHDATICDSVAAVLVLQVDARDPGFAIRLRRRDHRPTGGCPIGNARRRRFPSRLWSSRSVCTSTPSGARSRSSRCAIGADESGRSVEPSLRPPLLDTSNVEGRAVRACLNRAVKRAMARDRVKPNVGELTDDPRGLAGRSSWALTAV